VDTYIERHFDYVLGPNQDAQLASVPPGVLVQCALRLSANAPFILRSRALRIAYTTDGDDQVGLQHILARHYSPDRVALSQNVVRQSLLAPYFGQVGNPIPQHPEIFYPANGEIRVDIFNDGTTVSNLTFYFRGVELYKPGAVKSYGYPDKFATLPFTYPLVATALPVTTNGQLITFVTKADADFVLQALQSGFLGNATAGTPVEEVFLQLQDEDQKPYSNDFVHADILAGNSGWDITFPDFAGSHIPPVMGGPNLPGIVYPEIYIPQNHNFYVNVKRTDAAYQDAAAVDYPISFIGQKVFKK
jgi:hypothetical protein